MQVAVILGTVLMCTCSTLLLVFSSHIGKAFSADPAVVRLTTATVLPLAISLIGETMIKHWVSGSNSDTDLQ